MYKIPFQILGTGSSGNAVVVGREILIDCGVPHKLLSGVSGDIKLVLLTHIHSDHFNRSTLRRLATDRPLLRFGCGEWLVKPLLDIGIRRTKIDILHINKRYNYSGFSVIPFPLVHNVPNQGYKIHFQGGGRMIYATDTGSMSGIVAKDYDLYLVEANYEEEEIRRRITEKEKNGEYAYERHAIHNHLSLERCNEWIYSQIGATGEYVYMHQHRDGGRHDTQL